MNKLITRIASKALLGATLAVSGLFGLNASIIFLAQPGNIQAGEREEIVSQYGTVSIAFIDDLKAGGLGKLSAGTTGYVNVLSPEPVIYLNGTEFEKAPRQSAYIYKHELAHILQKELVAKESGGYPTVSNPIVSFTYYYKLLQLNHDFTQLTPEADHEAIRHSPFAGLERAADCFAQKIDQEDPLTYLGSSFCNPEQRYIALSLLSERWPAKLTEEEKQKASVSPYAESHQKPKPEPGDSESETKNLRRVILPKPVE